MMTSLEVTSQQKIAKLAGFGFLFFTIVSILHYAIIELNLIVTGNTAEIAQYIKVHEAIFRFGIVHDLLIFISGMLLSVGLYIIFKPFHKNLALIALVWMLIETIIAIMIEFSSLIVLTLLNGNDYLSAFTQEQLHAIVGLVQEVRAVGYMVATIFFDLGMICFVYLFIKSAYISRVIGVWGFASLVFMFFGVLLAILLPKSSSIYETGNMIIQLSSMSVMLFQIVLGVWLLLKGLRLNP